MVVNIHDYVDRYINSYVFYHWQHFSDDESNAAAYLFQGKYQEALNDIGVAALGSEAQASMFNSGDKAGAAASLQIANSISDGSLLQEALDEIATDINNEIDYLAVTYLDIEQLYKQALEFGNIFEKGFAEYNAVRKFLTLLTSALDMAGGYSETFLKELWGFGSSVTGIKKFSFNPGTAKSSAVMSHSQLVLLEKIQQYLANAKNAFLSSGKELSKRSFESTISTIFKKTIMRSLASSLMSDTMQLSEEQIDDILISLGCKPERGNGKRQRVFNSTSKISVINTKGMQLNVTKNGQTATIEIGTDMQVESVGKSKNVGDSINIVARSTIGSMYPVGTSMRYYAANLIAHQNNFSKEYDIMRASTAASFIRDSILSTNQQTSQFLLINGYVYPVLTLIKNMCDEFMQNRGDIFPAITIQEFDKKTNSWKTDENAKGPSVRLALLRSQLVNNIINQCQNYV